jgi:hypothetical protein
MAGVLFSEGCGFLIFVYKSESKNTHKKDRKIFYSCLLFHFCSVNCILSGIIELLLRFMEIILISELQTCNFWLTRKWGNKATDYDY